MGGLPQAARTRLGRRHTPAQPQLANVDAERIRAVLVAQGFGTRRGGRRGFGRDAARGTGPLRPTEGLRHC